MAYSLLEIAHPDHIIETKGILKDISDNPAS